MTKKSVEVPESAWAACAFEATVCAETSAKEEGTGADTSRVIQISRFASILSPRFCNFHFDGREMEMRDAMSNSSSACMNEV
jgi:hypothetical protein